MVLIGLAFISVIIVCACLYVGNKATVERLEKDKDKLHKHNGELAEALRKLSHEPPALKLKDLLIHKSNTNAETSGCIVVKGGSRGGKKAYFDKLTSELKEREKKEGTTHINKGDYKQPELSNEAAKLKAIKAEERKRRTDVWGLVRGVMSYYFMRNRTHSVDFHLRNITDSIGLYKKGNSKHSRYKILTNIAANAISALESDDNESPFGNTFVVTGEAQESEGPSLMGIRIAHFPKVSRFRYQLPGLSNKYKLHSLEFNGEIYGWVWREGYPTKFAHSYDELIRQLDEQQGNEIGKSPQLTPLNVHELMRDYSIYQIDELPGGGYKFRYRWLWHIEYADNYSDLIHKLETYRKLDEEAAKIK